MLSQVGGTTTVYKTGTAPPPPSPPQFPPPGPPLPPCIFNMVAFLRLPFEGSRENSPPHFKSMGFGRNGR